MVPAFVPLQGRLVRLEPLTPDHRAAVGAMMDCDTDLWAIMSSSGQGAHFATWWASAMADGAKGERMPYAIRRLADGAIVGTTSYLSPRPAHRGVEIGSSFLHPSVRGGPVNPESKYLLLAHAFTAGAVRVEFVIDVRNERSQAAVAKLGAVREGVLRNHKITWTGHVRDSAVYAITDREWPAVRAGLEARLAGFA